MKEDDQDEEEEKVKEDQDEEEVKEQVQDEEEDVKEGGPGRGGGGGKGGAPRRGGGSKGRGPRDRRGMRTEAQRTGRRLTGPCGLNSMAPSSSYWTSWGSPRPCTKRESRSRQMTARTMNVTNRLMWMTLRWQCRRLSVLNRN